MFRDIDEDGSGIVSLAEFEEAGVSGKGNFRTTKVDSLQAFKDQAICDKFLMLGRSTQSRKLCPVPAAVRATKTPFGVSTEATVQVEEGTSHGAVLPARHRWGGERTQRIELTDPTQKQCRESWTYPSSCKARAQRSNLLADPRRRVLSDSCA